MESGFSASLESPRCDKENKALLRGGMQTAWRGRRRKGEEKLGKERQCVCECVCMSVSVRALPVT